jgi:hypothetical protein
MMNLPLLLLPKSPPSKPRGLAKREFITLSSLSNSSMNCKSVVLWGSNLSSTLGLGFSEKLGRWSPYPLYK